ncbi:MAG: hypothetical protein IPJ32_18265 [Sphingobacteriaceae bacterium]|nr:hypothetical protein [Sphingobacteriaceae bacterium]
MTNEKETKKKTNWDRIVYLILLFLFVLFILYYILNKLLMVHAYGHVIIESTKIRLTDDARIAEMRVHEGDSVVVGDTLFTYSLDLDQDISGPNAGGTALSIAGLSGGSRGNTDYWWLKELYNVKKTIAINTIKVNENTELIKNFEGELKRMTNEVILDVLPKQRLDYLQTEIYKLKAENLKLVGENNQLYGLMKTLKPFDSPTNKPASIGNINIRTSNKSSEQKNYYRTDLLFSGELLSDLHYFTAPMDGLVTRIFIQPTETALKTEEIMTLHKNRPAFIKAYFEQEDLANFKEGDIFKVTFPDGSTSYGMLKRFYIATYVLPEEFQKKYEPTTRSVAADIYPLNNDDLAKWKAFYKMGVDISKFKFQ